jgi:hypothetical protein
LFRERVSIALTPDALAFVRAAGGPRLTVRRHGTVECDKATGTEPWRGSIAALMPLADSLKGEFVDVTVVLSNHFVRYLLVRLEAGLETDEEELAFARFCLARIHGERSKAWQVRLDRGSHGAARIASAVDHGLLQAVRNCFPPGRRPRLVSIRPYLMAAVNHWRGRISATTAAFLTVEPGRACLARMRDRHWSAVHSSKGNFDAAPQWAQFLKRERYLDSGSIDSTDVLVHAATPTVAYSAEAGGWRFRRVPEPLLAGMKIHQSSSLAIALCAL